MSMKKRRLTLKVSAAEKVGSTSELVAEILLRVAAIDVIRMKLVCKAWHLLISDRYFRRLHALRNPSPRVSGFFLPRKYFCSSKSGLSKDVRLRKSKMQLCVLPFDPSDPNSRLPPRTTVIECDDGLIREPQFCKGLLFFQKKLKNKSSTVFNVANPTTGETVRLPSIPLNLPGCRPDNVLCFTLAFDPVKSPYYKVVCFCEDLKKVATDGGHYSYQPLIYSSETGAWKSAGSPIVHHQPLRDLRGLYHNGRVHWRVDDIGSQIWCFDLDTECIVDIPALPFQLGCSSYEIKHFGEWNDRLLLIVGCNLLRGSYPYVELRFFEMDRDYSSWRFTRKVDWTGNFFMGIQATGPLLKADEDDDCQKEPLQIAVSFCAGKVLLCNLRGMRVRELASVFVRDLSCSERWMGICLYSESLIPI